MKTNLWVLLQGFVWQLGGCLPSALPLPAASLQCVPPRLALGGSAHLDGSAVAYLQAGRGVSRLYSPAEDLYTVPPPNPPSPSKDSSPPTPTPPPPTPRMAPRKTFIGEGGLLGGGDFAAAAAVPTWAVGWLLGQWYITLQDKPSKLQQKSAKLAAAQLADGQDAVSTASLAAARLAAFCCLLQLALTIVSAEGSG